MKTCINCQQFDLRELPKMARLGFGWCPPKNTNSENGSKSRAITVSVSAPTCEHFHEATALVSANRVEWISRALA